MGEADALVKELSKLPENQKVSSHRHAPSDRSESVHSPTPVCRARPCVLVSCGGEFALSSAATLVSYPPSTTAVRRLPPARRQLCQRSGMVLRVHHLLRDPARAQPASSVEGSLDGFIQPRGVRAAQGQGVFIFVKVYNKNLY